MQSGGDPFEPAGVGATRYTCRSCGAALEVDAAACPACGALPSVVAPPNIPLFIVAGAGLGIACALAALAFDVAGAGSRAFQQTVVIGTYVAIVLVFFVGVAALVRGRAGLGFLLMTAGFVAIVPAFVFGTLSLACMK